MIDQAVDRLGPYPILQFAAAIVVLGGLAYAVVRSQKDKGRTVPPLDSIAFPQIFFQGPLVEGMKILGEVREEMRKQTGILLSIKRRISPSRQRKRRRR